jgi:hypothetical protein
MQTHSNMFHGVHQMNGINRATTLLLSSLLEVFATVRSALATYAVSMVVTNGDQTFSLFTVAVVEGALILSMLSIGLDPVSPLTAIAALVFSAVMQYLEISLLQGSLNAEQKNTLLIALAFAPTVLLALGILRRLTEDGNTGALASLVSRVMGFFKPSAPAGASKSYGFTVAPGGKAAKGSWVETRKVVRFRDASGRKRYVPQGAKRAKRRGGV